MKTCESLRYILVKENVTGFFLTLFYARIAVITVIRLWDEWLGFEFWQGRIFLFTQTSRLAL
jgi:hypothetical protein